MTTVQEFYYHCDDCSTTLIPTVSGKVCPNCGLVSEAKKYASHFTITLNDQWKYHDQYVDILGMYGTRLDIWNRDNLTAKQLTKAKRLHQSNCKFNTSNTIMILLHTRLTEILNILELKSLRPKIWLHFSKLEKTNRPKNRIALFGALIHYYMKKDRIPINMDEMIQAFLDNGHWLTKRMVVQCMLKYQLKNKNFGYKVYLNKYISLILNSPTTFKQIKRVHMTLKEFQQVLETPFAIKKFDFSTLNPSHLAAGILYGRIKLHRDIIERWILSQQHVAQILGINEFSIRDIWQILKRYMP